MSELLTLRIRGTNTDRIILEYTHRRLSFVRLFDFWFPFSHRSRIDPFCDCLGISFELDYKLKVHQHILKFTRESKMQRSNVIREKVGEVSTKVSSLSIAHSVRLTD